MNHRCDQTIVTVTLFALLLLGELIKIKKHVLLIMCKSNEFKVEWTFTGQGLNQIELNCQHKHPINNKTGIIVPYNIHEVEKITQNITARISGKNAYF